MHAQGLVSHRRAPVASAPIGACSAEVGECSSRCGRPNRHDILTSWGDSCQTCLPVHSSPSQLLSLCPPTSTRWRDDSQGDAGRRLLVSQGQVVSMLPP